MLCIMHLNRVPVHKTPFCFMMCVLGTVNCVYLIWMELLHVFSVFSYCVEWNVFRNFLRISKIVLYSQQERQENLIRIYTTLLATNTRSVVGNPRNDYTQLVDSPLTLILLTWRIWWATINASRWQVGFNLVFKGLMMHRHINLKLKKN